MQAQLAVGVNHCSCSSERFLVLLFPETRWLLMKHGQSGSFQPQDLSDSIQPEIENEESQDDPG